MRPCCDEMSAGQFLSFIFEVLERLSQETQRLCQNLEGLRSSNRVHFAPSTGLNNNLLIYATNVGGRLSSVSISHSTPNVKCSTSLYQKNIEDALLTPAVLWTFPTGYFPATFDDDTMPLVNWHCLCALYLFIRMSAVRYIPPLVNLDSMFV